MPLKKEYSKNETLLFYLVNSYFFSNQIIAVTACNFNIYELADFKLIIALKYYSAVNLRRIKISSAVIRTSLLKAVYSIILFKTNL